MLPTPVGASSGLPSSAKPGLTKPPSSAAEEIADDAAQVSMVGMLISQANTGSDVRFEKVAALRRKIEAGTYRVDAEDVAEKLMGEMRKK